MALYNYDQGLSGIYRAILLRSSSDPNARVYIPSLFKNTIPCPVYTDGMLNEIIYKENINSYPIVNFCNFELSSSTSFAISCWVTFETGNINYPIIIGYFANSWFPGTLNLVGMTSNPDFTPFEFKDWCYPLSIRTTTPVAGAARHFGANRSGTSRKHAAIDLIINDTSNTKIVACTNGSVVANNRGFYQESDNDLQIKNTDGSVLRYAEIISTLQVGAHVNRGDIIGSSWINSSGNSMLHIELYKGTATGSLSDSSNYQYDYVTSLYYARRRDLLDPSFIENLPLIEEIIAKEREKQQNINNNENASDNENQENNDNDDDENEGDEE